MNSISKHPVWLVGFRPFFILAALSGMIMPMLWVFIFKGSLGLPAASFTLIQWHAHEMFFGFGFAVLGGFLLTATKNWVHVRGYHGGSLIFLTLAWLQERLGMVFGGTWPRSFFFISNNLFLASLLFMLLRTLVLNRKTDTYKDNLYFVIVLPLFLVSKYFILSPEYFKLGMTMAIGLFRMAFLVMLERTLTQFMKNTFQVQILRNWTLDTAIKVLGLLLIFETLLPTSVSIGIYLSLGVLLSIRFVAWKPQWAFRRIDISIMYLGYLALTLHLFLVFLSKVMDIQFVGTAVTHVFTFGVMGFIIPAMLIRISNGHTGRKVVFDVIDKAVIWVMIIAFIVRIIAPQFFPAQYSLWISAAAWCWFASFSILAWRYSPILMRPRLDGKEH